MADIPKFEDTEEVTQAPKFEDTVPSFDETEAIEAAPVGGSEASDMLYKSGKTVGLGAAGAAVGGGIGKLGVSGLEKVLPYLGELNKNQIDLISSDPTSFKSSQPLENILDTWKDLSSKTQSTGINSARAARESLKGLKNIPVGDIYNVLSKEPSNPIYSTPISPNSKNEIADSLVNATKPEVDELNLIRNNISNSLKEIEDLKSKPISDKSIDLRELQANRSFDRKMSSLKNVNQSDLIFKKLQSDEKLDLSKNKKETSILERLGKQKEKLENKDKDILKKIQEKTDDIKTKTATEYAKLANIPEELNVGDRFLRPEYSEQVRSAVDKIKPAKSVGIEPATLDQMLQELREGVNYDGQGSKVKDFNKNMARDVRGLLGEISPEYDSGMKNSSKLQDLQEQIENYTKVKFDKDPNSIRFPDSARNSLGKTLLSGSSKDPSLKNSRQELESLIEQLHSNGIIDTNTKNNFIKSGETSALRDFVENSNTKLSLGDAADITSPSTWASKAAKTGTKGQALVAKNLPGIKSIVPKVGGGLGLLLGLTTGAMAAGDAGLEGAEKYGVATASAIDPNPFGDVVGGYVAGKDAYKNTGSIPETLKAGAKAYVKPMDDFGTSQSTDARSRMEQNMNASTKTKNNDFLNFISKSPEALNDLAKQLESAQNGSSSYAAPLAKAASADERSKAAILYGLYQQPGFRSLVEGNGTLKTDIPGVKKDNE